MGRFHTQTRTWRGNQGIGGISVTTPSTATPADGTQTGGAPNEQPSTAPGGSPQTGASTTTPNVSVSMTREELDRQLADARRSGERGARESDEIKQLRAAAKRLQDIEEAQKTETEKLTDRAAKAEAERDALVAKYRQSVIHAAFTTAAMEKGLRGQPLADALALADLAALEVGDDGAVKGVEKALETVLKDRPYLLGTAGGQANGARPAPNINAGERGGQPGRDEQIAQAQRELQQTGRYGRL